MSGLRLCSAAIGMLVGVMFSAATMAATFGNAISGERMGKSVPKDDVSKPIMCYGYGSLSGNVAYSPGAKTFLTGSKDGKARLFDIDSGALLHTFAGHLDKVTCVAFSPDESKALTGSRDNTARLWNAETGALIRTFTGQGGDVSSVTFSPDGTKVLTGVYDNTAKLWDAETGALLHTFTGHTAAVSAVAFSPDGTKVLTGSTNYDYTMKLWDAKTGALIWTARGHKDSIQSVTFSPDGTKVLTGSWDDTAKLWDTETGTLTRTFTGHTYIVSSAEFSPDGTKVLTGSWDRTAKLWDAESGTLIRTFVGHTGAVSSATFSPDGAKVLTGAWDNTVRLWDTATGAELHTFAGHTGGVLSVVFSPDGTKVLTGSDASSKMAILWDAVEGTVIRTFTGHKYQLNTVAFSPDGAKVLTGSSDDTAKLWDAATGNEIRTFTGFGGNVQSAVFSPDGTKVLAGGSGAATLWDAEAGNLIRTFTGQNGSIFSVAFSPDGTKALTGSTDATAKLWDVETGALLHTFNGHTSYVYSVAFSPDGTKVLTGSADTTAKLWDAETGAELRSFSCGDGNYVKSVAYSPDGTKVITGSGKSAQLWDVTAGALVRTFNGYADRVYSVAFSPDSSKVLTGSIDGTTGLWTTAGVDVGVPSVAGKTRADAQALLTVYGLGTGAVTQACSDTVTDDVVISQNPAAGTLLPPGSVVTMVVSTGPCPVTIPDIVGKTQAEAETTFAGSNLVPGNITQACSDMVMAGLVISQNPASGQQAPHGSAVAMTVSTGPCPVTVPNVVDKTEPAAGDMLSGMGLTVGNVTQACSETVAAGLVISQNPAAGQQVHIGSTVALVVSTGPCPVSVPNVVGQMQSMAADKLTNAGLRVGTTVHKHSLTVPKCNVMSQHPEAGTLVSHGSNVDLVVSRGGIAVPDVVNHTRGGAIAALLRATLVVGLVTEEYSPTVPAGMVTNQIPAANTEVLPGASVNLAVSLGPPPPPEGEGEAPVSASVAQQHLAGAFNQTDTNDDGRLSFREAVVAVPGLGQETFDSLDVNGDGQLTPDELGMSDCYGCKGCQGGNSASVGDGFAFLFWLLGLIVMAHVKGG